MTRSPWYALVGFKTGQTIEVEISDGRFPLFMSGKRGENLKPLVSLPDPREPGVWYFKRAEKSFIRDGSIYHQYDEV